VFLVNQELAERRAKANRQHGAQSLAASNMHHELEQYLEIGQWVTIYVSLFVAM
jgi:hypothetical protein